MNLFHIFMFRGSIIESRLPDPPSFKLVESYAD
jgi:hypothetical protein